MRNTKTAKVRGRNNRRGDGRETDRDGKEAAKDNGSRRNKGRKKATKESKRTHT